MDKKNYNITEIIKIPFRCSKGYASLIAFQNLIEGVIPSLQVLITASFLDTAIQIANSKEDFKNIILPISLLVALIAYTWLSAQLIKFLEIKLQFSLREKFRVSLTEKRAKLKYKYIENQETWNLISRVSKEPEVVLKNAYINTLSFLSMILRIMGLLFILITQIWWAGIIILFMSMVIKNSISHIF